MILIPGRSRGHARAGWNHARAEMHSEEPADLTFDELMVFQPNNPIPPPLLAKFVEYRAIFEQMLPKWSRMLRKNPMNFVNAGLNVPPRFLPGPQISRERMLEIIGELYQMMLLERQSK